MTLKIRLRAVIFFSGIVLFGLVSAGHAVETQTPKKQQDRITGIQCRETSGAFLVTIRSDASPTYTTYKLFNPLRIVVDIADATLGKSVGLPMEVHKGPVAAITGQMLDEQKPSITRIEIALAKDQPYTIDRDKNAITVKFTGLPTRKPAAKPAGVKEMTQSPKGPPSKVLLLADVVVTTDPSATRILLKTGKPITKYHKAELPRRSGRPDRLYIDIPHLHMTDNSKSLQVGKALARVRMAHRGSGLRVVFDSGLDTPFKYDIKTVPQGLLVIVPESPSANVVIGKQQGEAQKSSHKGLKSAKTKPVILAASHPKKNLKSAKIEPVIPAASPPKKDLKSAKTEPVIPAASPPKKVQQKGPVQASSALPKKAEPAAAPLDELAMAGYTAQRISVDFYKIDLHNVFRLIGAVSGRNIVVDEGVKGTLTLALNNVPWDFVLDVILNLKGLQKEDRFNTIVISPKDKKYTWPKRPADKLAIAPNGSVMKQEAISIKKKQETPQEIIDAQKLILRGNEQYRAGRYDAALPLYEEAFAKWPKNKQLAGRIAALALVQLGQNAKAVHYAKAVLELDPHNSEAALQAAIGLANMKKTDEARKYFDLAIAGSRPNGEALLSYAAFCENNGRLKTALALIAKHEEIQGDTLESMVAKARLLDKLGRSKEANEEYRAVLLSGFKVPPDLKRYIQGRMAVANR